MSSHSHEHDHDHSTLSEMDVRVRALETLLTQKGYIDPAGIDRIITDDPAALAQLPGAWREEDRGPFGLQRWSRVLEAEAQRPLPPGTCKITYTSGSTGHPKGVCLSAEALDTVAASLAAVLRPLGVIGMVMSLSHLAPIFASWWYDDGALRAFVVSMLFKPNFTISAEKERWAGAVVGTVSGMLGGVSSLMGPIMISYMLALKMRRDEFVGAVSVIYLNAAWPLYLAMYSFGRMEVIDIGYSVLALVPMAIGLMTGQKLRHRLSEDAFRKVLLGFLTFIAVLLVVR